MFSLKLLWSPFSVLWSNSREKQKKTEFTLPWGLRVFSLIMVKQSCSYPEGKEERGWGMGRAGEDVPLYGSFLIPSCCPGPPGPEVVLLPFRVGLCVVALSGKTQRCALTLFLVFTSQGDQVDSQVKDQKPFLSWLAWHNVCVCSCLHWVMQLSEKANSC